MSVQFRNNVNVLGSGPATMVFAHGFGCDQNMWRLLAPQYARRFRTVRFDMVGAGNSDLSAWHPDRYATLQGYADDVVEIIEEFGQGPVVFVGHSVSAMIGMLADLKAPGSIAAQVMVGPSPCFINHDEYVGGFEQEDIDAMLDTLDSNYLGWASNMAPAIMGAPGQPELAEELTTSFCRTDPDIARHFARVTFTVDVREQLPRLKTPSLILQCSDDIVAPRAVGEYMQRNMPAATLAVVDNVGHCPHMSSPGASTQAIDDFLARQGL